MKKIAFLILFLSFFTNKTYAADFNIVCTDNVCQADSSNPIFSFNNVYPNFSSKKNIQISNTRNDKCALLLRLEKSKPETNNISSKINISISKNTSVLYAGTLKNLIEETSVELDSIKPKEISSYQWVASVSQDADNSIFNSLVEFDIDFDFQCLPVPVNPTVLITSFPNDVKIGDTFSVTISLINGKPNTNYYYKIFGGVNSDTDILTFNGTNYLSYTPTPWTSFPNIYTDSSGNFTTQLIAKTKNDGSIGIYNVRIRVRDDQNNITTSDTKNITVHSLTDLYTPSQTNVSTSNQSVCNDPAPAGFPTITRIIPGINNATIYWEENSSPMTYYLIAFGTRSGEYVYGNPNIGGPGTKSYTVNNLSSDKTYYFKIRSGNGCSPGAFSNEVSVKPLGNVLANTNPPTGFEENVLGVDTTQVSPVSDINQSAESVAGESTNNYKQYIFYGSFVIILLVSGNRILKFFLKKLKTR